MADNIKKKNNNNNKNNKNIKKKKRVLKNKYILAVLACVCVALMVVSVYFAAAGRGLKGIAGVTVVPLQKGVSKVSSWVSGIGDRVETLKEVKEENAELREKINMLIVENNSLQEEHYELERMEALLKLDEDYLDYEKIGAHVIGKDAGNWFSTFTIDKGSNDGIKVDMNVLAGGGLAGIVINVGPNWATVRSIIDDASNVSGMTLSTSDKCMVRGDLALINDGKIRFEQMENNDNVIQIGDQIVTSHISSKYLQGILIGYITEINVDSNNLTRSGYISPVVDFKNLQEVLVITKTKGDLMSGDGVTENE